MKVNSPVNEVRNPFCWRIDDDMSACDFVRFLSLLFVSDGHGGLQFENLQHWRDFILFDCC
jgi:hypothetical protein